MTFKRRALLLAMAAASLAASHVAQAQQAGPSVLETIKQRGKLVIGLSTFVPWAMLDKSGQLVGFEIDVGKKLAADMGKDGIEGLADHLYAPEAIDRTAAPGWRTEGEPPTDRVEQKFQAV